VLEDSIGVAWDWAHGHENDSFVFLVKDINVVRFFSYCFPSFSPMALLPHGEITSLQQDCSHSGFE
jgi:hypothetical protein